MAVLGKMKVDKKTIVRGATHPQEHFEERHEYSCACEWIPGEQTTVELSVVTSGDGGDNASFAAATPSGEMWLVIENQKAADYFEFEAEYYIEIRKARS